MTFVRDVRDLCNLVFKAAAHLHFEGTDCFVKLLPRSARAENCRAIQNFVIAYESDANQTSRFGNRVLADTAGGRDIAAPS